MGWTRRAGRREVLATRTPEVDPALLDAVRMSRRTLLKYTTALGTLGLVELKRKGDIRTALAGAVEPDVLTVTLTRPDDMLALRFDFVNLHLIKGFGEQPARLVRTTTSADAFVVVHFEPQAIAEQAFREAQGKPQEPIPTPPVKGLLTHRSRLAFELPTGVNEIPFRLDSLLDWEPLTPSLHPVMDTPADGSSLIPEITAPAETETAIEFPWRLYISPGPTADWEHSIGPVDRNGRIELWHTRMNTEARAGQITGDAGIARAIWTDGFQRTTPQSTEAKPFLMPLNAYDRWRIVRLTSDYRLPGALPKPVLVDQLMLTALGAWVDLHGDWNSSDSELGLKQWQHKATMGRDHYVKVVNDGYLFPYGHRAVLTVISERKFHKIDSGPQAGKIGAYVMQRMFIVVRTPEVAYNDRFQPYRLIRLVTRQTPDLNSSDLDPLSDIEGVDAFWPRVGKDDFLFHIEAEDWDGQTSEFTTPMIWVPSQEEADGRLLKSHLAFVKASEKRRRRPLHGQRVAFAPSSEDKPGDTTLEVDRLEFRGYIDLSRSPAFVPKLQTADVRLTAVEQLKGSQFNKPSTVGYHDTYVKEGFEGSNADSQIFAVLADPKKLDFGKEDKGDRSGGIATPNMSIGALSRKTGPVGGEVKKNAVPQFDPKTFFDKATILGGIALSDIIQVTDGFNDAPSLITKIVYPDNDITEPPTQIESTLTWLLPDDRLKPDPAKIFEPAPSSFLRLDARFVTPLAPGALADFQINGRLSNFVLHMIGKDEAFLILHFKTLSFSTKKGKKPNVDVDIGDVEFSGILSFVNQLRDFMKSSGSGLSIDVTGKQIEAGYTLGIPTVAVGIFSLQNMSLSAGVIIPFTGDPVSARFGFCTREAPFIVSYAIFGGGGFFGITVGKDPKGDLGINSFEAAIEFGATAAIDIGVASGSVHIMAGIYFAMGTKQGCSDQFAELTGYVRLGGELDVMGIVSMSLEFYLGLTYDFAEDELWGQATLVVEVDVLLFSGSVELTVEKHFAGGSGNASNEPDCDAPTKKVIGSGEGPLDRLLDPLSPQPILFGQLVDADDWNNDYAPAFSNAAFA